MFIRGQVELIYKQNYSIWKNTLKNLQVYFYL